MMILGTDFKSDFSSFLKNGGIFICIGIVIAILAAILLIIFIPKIKNKKHKNKIDTKITSNDYITALGGIDNIINVSQTMSRIKIEIKDPSLVDVNKLKTLEIDNVITMSNVVTLITNKIKADQIVEIINSGLN